MTAPYGSSNETATQTLHRLTSYVTYDEERVWDPPVDDPRAVTSFTPNDFGRLPWFFKRYDESLPTVPLPRDLPETSASAVSVLAGTATVGARELDLAQLSRLLHLSAGVVRATDRRGVRWPFRAAGSAGARFPLEVYVTVPDGTALTAGVHWYYAQQHALVRVGPPPRGDAPTIVVTGVPWRTGWRYRERGYRHIYWDAGTMLSQLLALADAAAIPRRLYSRFPDTSVSNLVGADGVDEWPVAVVALGRGAPAIEATGEAVGGRIDSDPVEFPLETSAQRAGDLDELGDPWSAGEAVEVPLSEGEAIERVILARGSIRLLDASRIVSGDVLRTSMRAAMRGMRFPHFVVVHSVDGFEPGIYRWPDLATPRRRGQLRDELYAVAMEQDLARDASFVAVGAADVSSLDDRGYREAQLAAGLVEGRLHLLAYALGAAASGMTFVDDSIRALLGEPLDGLLLTCVGVPEYRSARGGMPGSPTEISMVTPRTS